MSGYIISAPLFIGLLLLLGGVGVKHTIGIRLNERGEIISGLVAGAGIVFVAVGIVLGQV